MDVTQLTPKQLNQAEAVFDDFKDRPLKPFNEIANDTVRHELDKEFFATVLGLNAAQFLTDGPFSLLRSKFDNEPSIQGSKLR